MSSCCASSVANSAILSEALSLGHQLSFLRIIDLTLKNYFSLKTGPHMSSILSVAKESTLAGDTQAG